MAVKKRKSSRNSEPAGPKEVDAKDARLTIRTFEDVADEQEEHWSKKDRIDFDSDEERSSKRLRRQEKEDAFLEASDEEVFAEDDSDEEGSEEEDDSEEENEPLKKQKGKVAKGKIVEYSEDEAEQEEEGDEGYWGSSRKDYYDADTIENEADALEEEAEAKRLQVKKLAKMQEADFAFDESDWLNPQKPAGKEDVVIEVLKDAEVTEDMGPEERYNMLLARYPEFDYLVDEFRELQPLLPLHQKEAEGKATKSLEVVKFWVLGCYLATLASYFAILTSPARDGDGSTTTINPAELRDHEVMETLMKCRAKWLQVKNLKSLKPASSDLGMLSPPKDEDLEMPDVAVSTRKRGKRTNKADKKALELQEAAKVKKAKAAAKSLADLSTLLKTNKKLAKTDKVSAVRDDDERSDFGEEETLDARTAADKAQRKKSLKFYTSQIVQKASKRADAGRDAGGDADIPYRERFRDRQMRLNADAVKRGKKDQVGTELGGDDSGDEADVKKVRGEDDEYYDMVANQASKKNTDKKARFEAIAAARKGERIVEASTIGTDGKRQISYQIQKNKGLMPHRRKEVRNPRVKKRMMYEKSQKTLRSVKATFKGGEGKGGYQGEMSGINTRVVKSVKL